MQRKKSKVSQIQNTQISSSNDSKYFSTSVNVPSYFPPQEASPMWQYLCWKGRTVRTGIKCGGIHFEESLHQLVLLIFHFFLWLKVCISEVSCLTWVLREIVLGLHYCTSLGTTMWKLNWACVPVNFGERLPSAGHLPSLQVNDADI